MQNIASETNSKEIFCSKRYGNLPLQRRRLNLSEPHAQVPRPRTSFFEVGDFQARGIDLDPSQMPSQVEKPRRRRLFNFRPYAKGALV